MNDTLQIKALKTETFDAANYDAAIDFARIVSADKNYYARSNTALGLLNPTTVRIAQTPPTAKNAVSKSFIAMDQSFARVDAYGAVLVTDKVSGRFGFDRSLGATEIECVDLFEKLCGALLADGCALFKQLLAGQR